MGFVKAVDEMQAARPATSGAGGQATGQLTFGPRGKGAGLFVAHVNEADRAFRQRMGEVVHGVADDAIASLDAGRFQHLDKNVGYNFCHNLSP